MQNYSFDEFDKYDVGKKSRLPFRKRWLVFGIFLVLLIGFVIFFFSVMPRKDGIKTDDLPSSYIIVNEDNYYAFQGGRDCAGYATAYVLRHLGIEASGSEIYKGMSTLFGSVALSNIVETLDFYRLSGSMYYGTIDTLKAQVNKGVPVICLVKIILGGEVGTHYVDVVGYDENYIYMADSTEPKANIFDNKMYDRKVTYSEWEELWDTGSYPGVKNCYVVVEK